MWTVTLDVPGDPDVDEATAYTTLVRREPKRAGVIWFASAAAILIAPVLHRRR